MKSFSEDLIPSIKNYNDFAWPINTLYFMELTKEIIENSVLLIRKDFNTDTTIDSALRTFNSHYIKKILNHIYCEVSLSSINNKKEYKGLEPYKNFLINEMENPGYLCHFRNGLRENIKSKNYFLSFLKNKIKNYIKSDGFTRVSSLKTDKIVSTGGGELASRYLKSRQEHDSAYLINIGDIFDNNPLPINFLANDEIDKLKSYLDGIQQILSAKKYFDEPIILKELDDWAIEFLKYTLALFVDLEKKNIYMDHLWTGSAGIVWNKVLSIHVRRLGGKVTVFDHANGSNLSTNSFMQFVELQETDYFVTYTKKQAEYILANTDSRLYFNQKKPQIIHLYD